MCAVESVKMVAWVKSDITWTCSADSSQIQWLDPHKPIKIFKKQKNFNFVKTRLLNNQMKAFFTRNSLVAFIWAKNVDHVHHMSIFKSSSKVRV